MADLTEAGRLLGLGWKLCALHPNTKRPVGDAWNDPAQCVTKIDPKATGYGLPLFINGLVSIDPDMLEVAAAGLKVLIGKDHSLEELMSLGVRTVSTRKGSGGRAIFRAPAGDPLRWIRFTVAEIVNGKKTNHIALELRATSPNLQDCCPGVHYLDKDGVSCTQSYMPGSPTIDNAPELPDWFLEFWRKISDSALDHQKARAAFCKAAGYGKPNSLPVAHDAEAGLPFPSDMRALFNELYTVEDVLGRNGYRQYGERWAHPDATGSAGVRKIPATEDLWSSSHGGDPLATRPSFDGWAAFVQLEHDGKVAKAEAAMQPVVEKLADIPELEHFWFLASSNKIFSTRNNLQFALKAFDMMVGKVSMGEKRVKASTAVIKGKTVETLTWLPGKPRLIRDVMFDGEEEVPAPGYRAVNIYSAPPRKRGKASDVKPFLDLIADVYPGHEEHILNWFACRIQRPEVKINHALVFQGDDGIGKDTIIKVLKSGVGARNFTPIGPRDILGNFNPYLESVVIQVSEIHDTGNGGRFAISEALKTMVAAPPDAHWINRKNMQQYMVPNVCGVIVTSNHLDGLQLSDTDRRYYICTSQRKPGPHLEAYFNRLYAWFERGGMANCVEYLHTRDISAFNPKAAPPHTAGWDEMKAEIEDPFVPLVETALERLADGGAMPPIVTTAHLAEVIQNETVKTLEHRDFERNKNPGKAIANTLRRMNYVRLSPDGAAHFRFTVDGVKWSVFRRFDITEEQARMLAKGLRQAQLQQIDTRLPIVVEVGSPFDAEGEF